MKKFPDNPVDNSQRNFINLLCGDGPGKRK